MPYEPLPLFPLHTVLFPRMPLRLHIFEERYKEMVDRCIEQGLPFGVVLIEDGSEVGPPPRPRAVGTLARIVAVERLDDGRLNILAAGSDRFRLLDYVTDTEPYMVGMTEPLADGAVDPDETLPLVTQVADLFRKYFTALVEHAGVGLPEYELPTDPEEFSFVMAAVVHTDSAERQALLEMTDTVQRLVREERLLKKEMARLRRLTRKTAVRYERLTAAASKPYFSSN